MAISFRETVISGFADFWSRKLRSFITIFGIILGTMSIIVILSIVKGVKETTEAWMKERGGLKKVSIEQNHDYDNKDNLRDYFTLKEVLFIKSLIPEIKDFNPIIRDFGKSQYIENTITGSLMGVFPDYQNVEEWTVDKGRFISYFDMNQANDIAVIGTKVQEELFGNINPLGKYITVSGRRLEIVGIMKHRYMKAEGGNIMQGDNALSWMNEMIFIPLPTMIHKLQREDKIDRIDLKARSEKETTELRLKLENIVLNLRGGKAVFSVESAKEELEQMNQNSLMFQVIFMFISTISLLVGGIVIMNIMLASIQERTREIGVRLAVGARRIDIFMQFLVQTLVITFLGGLFGVITGFSLLSLVGGFLQVKMVADISMVMISLLICCGVGLIFGIGPAIQASNLDPVKALRYE